MFPEQRTRRLRIKPALRRMVRETGVSVHDLIYPLFIKEGESIKEPIDAMPGQFRYSPDRLSSVISEVVSREIPAVLLFGIPRKKDKFGTEAHKKDGVVQQAVHRIKDAAPDLLVITDVCLCEYTSHGHCGILDRDGGAVENDETLDVLAKVALSHAKAGADIIAPSDMMDGRVGIIREALDESGFEYTPIMSYSAKYASSFYGPFREAAGSAPSFGDRKGYQMDPANVREAMREIRLDVEEGADIIMVKPAMPYLDVIRLAADEFDEPLCAYQVSGEYAMIKAASAKGWLPEDACIMESVLSIKRAGADMLITYFACRVAELLS
ncbi:MAG: porphobilinogen synthase [Desulfomonilia bacterium]|nr:porphobilinogen synthase [Deltaproteobacteria bacterium]MDX9761566.1 porphobilinogen synthase [Desulfomonilia bacterium]HPW68499.1 porphobilinogen synthase [Deltaproteobacteria bacterium]